MPTIAISQIKPLLRAFKSNYEALLSGARRALEALADQQSKLAAIKVHVDAANTQLQLAAAQGLEFGFKSKDKCPQCPRHRAAGNSRCGSCGAVLR